MTIHITPLGAGQEVGKSCILISMGGKTIMLDCGIHAYNTGFDRYPNFSRIANSNKQLTQKIDLLLITHFHIDHIGALPVFTEQFGYDGPIYMTHPTKAFLPIMLEEGQRQQGDNKKDNRKGAQTDAGYYYTSEDITSCMAKVTGFDLKQTITLEGGLEFTAYYAGHVLGAAMFHIKYKNYSVVYTGDYNMTPDRHLEAASIPHLQPDLLITESTYGDMIRESIQIRENDFLTKVHECVDKGGKILVPSLALGRAQEMCALLDEYWEANQLKHPIYFAGGLTKRTHQFFHTFSNWTKQSKSENKEENFEFKHVKPFDLSLLPKLKLKGAMVIFASPPNLNSGTSLSILKEISDDEKNMIIMSGYCPTRTNARLISNHNNDKLISLYGNSTKVKDLKLTFKLSVANFSFSNHADLKGIMRLVEGLNPKNVILVHGDKVKMSKLKERIKTELSIPCYDPENMEHIRISTDHFTPIKIPNHLLQSSMEKYGSTLPKDLIPPAHYLPPYPKDLQERYSILVDDVNWRYDTKSHQSQYEIALETVRPIKSIPVEGILISSKEAPSQFTLTTPEEALKDHVPLVITNDHYKYYNPDILTYPYPDAEDICYLAITLLSSKLFKLFGPYALDNLEVHSHGFRIHSFNCFTSMFYAEEPGFEGPTFSVPGALFFHWDRRDDDLANKILACANQYLI
ncbi:Metallo-hydrolase/oxidoreductase [Conidiobolus coronatus NRRL 28638]|uniref:Metallo-hydrolase/oxidoreductase n=1 Tax=Conidiobolus coronatus (strain ATCC 28846 / CBS 209.66 / NRRL 28638) TaxID=796925 RepID=A0A137P9L3_CONC2|nr:Metallo-hydrolase/oxidoreductase [Conidiobolus coronatus NRRL 28638]|eukprot:KXN71696.1 Metallo-hydrolase/oxidoreductase [Conidiobolus coronatus NRRL 28638]